MTRVEEDSFKKVDWTFFFHNSSYKDMTVQFIDFCDPNDHDCTNYEHFTQRD